MPGSSDWKTTNAYKADLHHYIIAKDDDMNKIIEIKGLEKTYYTDSEQLTILKNLNLTVEQGTKVVIVGESGSGKTTVVNMITRLVDTTKGKIILDKIKTFHLGLLVFFDSLI